MGGKEKGKLPRKGGKRIIFKKKGEVFPESCRHVGGRTVTIE